MENTTSNKIKSFFKKNTFFVFIGILLALYVISMMFMVSYGLMNSLKGAKEYSWNKIYAPQEGWQFQNYILAFKKIIVRARAADGSFEKVGVIEMYLNSILYSVGCAFISAFVMAVTAYLTARFKYKFSGLIVGTVIVTMSLPIVGSTPSAIQLSKTFGLYDSIWGLWIMSGSFTYGVFFLVFHDAFKGFPSAYQEAAEIDGASELQVMFRIMMPLVKSVFSTIFLLRLIGLWNEYQNPLLYMPNKPTIAYGLYYFTFVNYDNTTFSTPMQLTGAFLVSIPIFIVFLIFQNRIMSNISIGGLKG